MNPLPSSSKIVQRCPIPPAGVAWGRITLLLPALLLLAASSLRAVNPEDAIFYDSHDPSNGTISVVNGGYTGPGYTGTLGAVTTVASNSVGSGVAFHPPDQGCVSPSRQLYYWDKTLLAFVSIDLTNASYPRTLVPVPTNPALVPGATSSGSGPQMVWDYSTGTILYLDFGANSAKSTIASGIYRLNPITGTNTLYAPVSNVGTVNALAIKQDGSAVYVFNENANTFGVGAVCSQIASSGALTTVDGGSTLYGNSSTQPRYYEAESIYWDILNQKLNIFDVGDDQTTARIIRLAPSATNAVRTFISNGNSGPPATYGGTVINSPSTGFTNTAGRIIYSEEPTDLSSVFPAYIDPASPTAIRLGTASFNNTAYIISYVPPTLPVITTPTATPGGAGTGATLGANVTSAGLAIVTPTIQSAGVVYSLTSANASPAIGGTGVTQVAAPAQTGGFTVPTSVLSPGAQYSYAGYVSTFYGLVYTSVNTFTTPNLPTVTTPTATAIGGTTATLGGNVTSDGGGSITGRGVVYAVTSTNSNPIINGAGVTNLSTTGTTGVFTVSAMGLATGTQYSYRAYAINGVGAAYTTATTFTTVAAPTANGQSVNVPFNTATAITLTGSDSNNPVQTLSYTISTQPVHGTLTGTAPNVTYTPLSGYHGADSFQFTTTNTSTLTSAPATVSLTVATGTPTANGQSVSVPFNTATAVTLSGTDPDSPALTLTYAFNQPAHGTLSGTAPNLTYTPPANFQGADSFTFTVSNGTNTSAPGTVSLTVAPGTPTANAQAVSVPFNTATAITLTGTDPDSPALALTYAFNQPTHGLLTGTAPNLTYTPTSGYQGADSFTFTVNNGTNTSNTATVSLTVAAGTPTANAQNVSVPFNTAAAITLTGSDPDVPALALIYTVVGSPTGGVLTGTPPDLTYTPGANFQGADSFTFTVSNGVHTSAPATVSLTVAAGVPTAIAQSLSIDLNTAVAVTLSGSDPDSPALTLTYAVTTLPAHGMLSGTVPNLTYTPAAGYAGGDSFAFTATNGQQTSAPATVSITVSGQPTLTNYGPQSAQVGATLTFTGTNLVTPLTVAFTGGRTSPAIGGTSTALTAQVPTGAQSGPITITTNYGTVTTAVNFTLLPTTPVINSAATANAQVGVPFSYQITGKYHPTSFGATGLMASLTLNPQTGVISGTPTAPGTFPITLSASNAAGTGTGPLTLTIAANPPVVTSTTTAQGQVGVPFSYQITANYYPTRYGVTGLMSSLTVNALTGLISGTPTVAGTYPMTINVYNNGAQGAQNLTVTIAANAPVITSAPTASGTVGSPFNYQITANYYPTRFGVAGLPAGLSVNATTGAITGTPLAAGTFALTLSAYNGTTGTQNLSLTVAPSAPVITSAATAQGQVGVPFSYQITADNQATTYGVTGLRNGLSVNAQTGLITGTPMKADTVSLTLRAYNAAGSDTKTLTVSITN